MKKNSSYNGALLVDLYELSMAASYFQHKPQCLASFDLFIRKLPKNRSFFIAAGIDEAVSFIRRLRFSKEDIRYLRSLKLFSEDFLKYLSTFQFTGSVWAMEEGSLFFPNEPVIRVVAPLIEAQILETRLLNTINLQTTIATKAARVVLAARGKPVYDFSLRRTHGTEAGNKVAKASFLAGFAGTSNVMAGKLYGIPTVGTMAHSFVMAFDKERDSFRAFFRSFPNNAILLVDTYDTIKGVRDAIAVAKEMARKGYKLKGIRLDSGRLSVLAQKARRLLDKEGLKDTRIFASGNLDEYKIAQLFSEGAPIDSFGVGTKMGVSVDAPYCDVIYKLSEISDAKGRFLPTMKLSQDKFTYPGRKQIYRLFDKKGFYKKDILGLQKEKIKGAQPLLRCVIENGIALYQPEDLQVIRQRVADNLAKLPAPYKKLKPSGSYPVAISPALRKLTRSVASRIRHRLKNH